MKAQSAAQIRGCNCSRGRREGAGCRPGGTVKKTGGTYLPNREFLSEMVTGEEELRLDEF
jgi:hypothetical protein